MGEKPAILVIGDEDNLIEAHYNPYREMFRDASAVVVREVFGQYVSPSDRIIEIGSGLGELVKLVPEYKGQIQETELRPKVVQANKAQNPDSNSIVASVYNLPFSSGSFNVAVGYSVFDTLSDLEMALMEVGRILVPKGRFIHFLDLHASPDTFLHRYAQSNFILFPLFETFEGSFTHLTGFQLVHKNNLETLYRSATRDLRRELQDYVQHPVGMYLLRCIDPAYLGKKLQIISDAVRSSSVETRILVSNDQFKEDITATLQRTGYLILENQIRSCVKIVSRNGIYNEYSSKNYFHNQVGLGFITFDPVIQRELGARGKGSVNFICGSCRQKDLTRIKMIKIC